MSLPLQLPLNVQLRDEATFANYYVGRNETLVNMLDVARYPAGVTPEPFIYFYGATGVGCSHLLQAACHQADAMGQRSIYLPMSELAYYPLRVLEGIETLQLVCIDDISAIAGNPVWEEAFFHLFNRLREKGNRLLVAAEVAPRQLNICLPDLVSRMSWGVVFHVQTLSDQEKMQALRLRAHLRGMDMTDDVARYILHRGSRDMQYLFETLERLDGATLRAKRKLSVPFVKQVMAW